MRAFALSKALGSAGCQPAVLGSLPSTLFPPIDIETHGYRLLCGRAAGKLPAVAGWQPALPIQQ